MASGRLVGVDIGSHVLRVVVPPALLRRSARRDHPAGMSGHTPLPGGVCEGGLLVRPEPAALALASLLRQVPWRRWPRSRSAATALAGSASLTREWVTTDPFPLGGHAESLQAEVARRLDRDPDELRIDTQAATDEGAAPRVVVGPARGVDALAWVVRQAGLKPGIVDVGPCALEGLAAVLCGGSECIALVERGRSGLTAALARNGRGLAHRWQPSEDETAMPPGDETAWLGRWLTGFEAETDCRADRFILVGGSADEARAGALAAWLGRPCATLAGEPSHWLAWVLASRGAGA